MSKKTTRGRSASTRRVGRVSVYLRGEVGYVHYYENGQRVRRRLGGSWLEAKQLAAQWIGNGQGEHFSSGKLPLFLINFTVEGIVA